MMRKLDDRAVLDQHEWPMFRDNPLPEDKVLVTGVS
jgi:hypothetical protein